MPNAWVAVDAGIDPLSWARLLRRAYRRVRDGAADGPASGIIRPIVAASWARSVRAGVHPRERPPMQMEPREARKAFRRHPLAPLLPAVQAVLVDVASYAHQVVAIADAQGMILWTGGNAQTLAAAERAHLMRGMLWSEEVTGTNAIGTSLVLDHPVQIFSAEHFKEVLHNWSSAAAPIHDPETRRTLGAVSLSGPFKAAHPHGFSLVVAAAHIAEAQLAHEAEQRDVRLKVEYLERAHDDDADPSAVVNRGGRVLLATPHGWLGSRLRLAADGTPIAPCAEDVTIEALHGGDGFYVRRVTPASRPAGRPRLRIEALGRDRADGTLAHRPFRFTPRHSEILVILAQHPDGLDEDALAAELYGSAIKTVTIRAEISRLRKLLGPVVKTRPYRLAADVSADFLDVEALVARGDIAAATAECPGPLLPGSGAPAVVATRERIEAALQSAPLGA